MKVVSFNLRYDTPEDGKNAFSYRKRDIVKKIAFEKPNFIGFQEALPHMVDYLRDELPDYCFVGHGRDADLGGEQGIVAYNRRIYDLMETHTLWLSPSPTVPGSRYANQSICPRTMIVCEFADRKGSGRIRVVNTHLDHIGKSARKKGLSQLLRHVRALNKKKNMATLVTGDFNAAPFDEEIVEVLGREENNGFFDASEGLPPTFHNFGRENEFKIDYILADRSLKVIDKGLWLCDEPNKFLSDHHPIWVEVE